MQPVPTCNLGPEGGVCACVDQPLVVDAPNIYFVLDRSGSMNDFNKWQTVRTVIARLVVELGTRATFGVTVFPNPGVDGCSPGIEVFAPRQGDAPAGTIGPTEAALITVLDRINASGGTPTAATFNSIAMHLRSLPGKTYVIFATDGGPNCNPGLSCALDQCQPNMENASGCPPAGPVNCCAGTVTSATGGPLACEDTAATVAAVKSLAASGIPVYVVGVPESEPYANVLSQLANVGGTARDVDGGDGGGTGYYAVTGTDPAALESALSAIAAQITGTCTFDLGSPPADPTLVNVFFDSSPLAQMGPDGWTLSGTTVTILGASCQQILTGGVLDVRVVAGCPTVQH
jgi:von Willebrand factor type A domain